MNRNHNVLRRVLLRRRAELLGEIRQEFDPGPLAGPMDEKDLAAALHDQYVCSAVSCLACQEISLVNRALERIRTGGYGICQDCGRRIPAPRLRSVPWVECCVLCQERRATASFADSPISSTLGFSD